MSLYGAAKGTAIEDMIRTLQQAEEKGSATYYVLKFLAKEKGYDDLAEAIAANAAEDASHGGKYGAMLGEGVEDDAEFWKLIKHFCRAESGAEKLLTGMAEKARQAGFEAIAKEIEATIPEELEHGERLAKVLKAHGQEL